MWIEWRIRVGFKHNCHPSGGDDFGYSFIFDISYTNYYFDIETFWSKTMKNAEYKIIAKPSEQASQPKIGWSERTTKEKYKTINSSCCQFIQSFFVSLLICSIQSMLSEVLFALTDSMPCLYKQWPFTSTSTSSLSNFKLIGQKRHRPAVFSWHHWFDDLSGRNGNTLTTQSVSENC